MVIDDGDCDSDDGDCDDGDWWWWLRLWWWGLWWWWLMMGIVMMVTDDGDCDWRWWLWLWWWWLWLMMVIVTDDGDCDCDDGGCGDVVVNDDGDCDDVTDDGDCDCDNGDWWWWLWLWWCGCEWWWWLWLWWCDWWWWLWLWWWWLMMGFVAVMFLFAEIITALRFSSDCRRLLSSSADRFDSSRSSVRFQSCCESHWPRLLYFSCVFVWRLAPELTVNMRERLSVIRRRHNASSAWNNPFRYKRVWHPHHVHLMDQSLFILI